MKSKQKIIKLDVSHSQQGPKSIKIETFEANQGKKTEI